MLRRYTIVSLSLLVLLSNSLWAEDEKVFSGPQVGEKLTSFTSVGAYDKLANKEIDVMKDAGDKPVMIIFVHKITRPAHGLTRGITGYAKKLSEKGLKTYVIWLTEDRTKTEAFLKRAKKSLNYQVPVAISKDGLEGPGAYGLNRKMTMTVLLGQKKKVTANFALIQPSLEADGPKIVKAMAKLVKAKAPTQQELVAMAYPGQGRQRQLLGLVRRMLSKDATEEDVKRYAARVEDVIKGNRRMQGMVGQQAARALKGEAGTEAARAVLKTWVKKYGPKKRNDR